MRRGSLSSTTSASPQTDGRRRAGIRGQGLAIRSATTATGDLPGTAVLSKENSGGATSKKTRHPSSTASASQCSRALTTAPGLTRSAVDRGESSPQRTAWQAVVGIQLTHPAFQLGQILGTREPRFAALLLTAPGKAVQLVEELGDALGDQ